jgi:predicted glycogen debranching enzyme
MIQFPKDICQNLKESSSLEWLETNGLGGYASSTVAGLNTRRYHGLLVAATKPPVGRLVMLSKLEETLVIANDRYELSTNRYPGVVYPEGFLRLVDFRLDPLPTYTYEVDGFRLEKSVFMLNGENATVIEYHLSRTGPPQNGLAIQCSLELRPLVAFRDYHSTGHEVSEENSRILLENGLVTLTPMSDLPPLYLAHNAEHVEITGNWYRNFIYDREIERGFDDMEDLFNPCLLSFDLATTAVVIASTKRHRAKSAANYRSKELKRRRTVVAPTRFNDALVRAMVTAADHFIVNRGDQKTVIAGYHWFGDWGRDTMIALPGLALIPGRIDVAQSILSAFAGNVSQGMLPNRFPDSGETPEYNTVDATLWFFEAARALAKSSNDLSFVEKNLYNTLVNIIDWHISGTRYNIKVDDDGLLFAGEEGVQLTWMDAKVGDHVITPRTGKPVEIQALWYNALCIMADFASNFGDMKHTAQYSEMADRAKFSFNEKFWNQEAGCLYDVINGESIDDSIRPNQIFAVSLPNTMLEQERARRVVATVERELLTPYGLRSLSPNDPKYIGHYEGGPEQRDDAYHQGTVWAWLIGPFLTAYVRVNDGSRDARDQAEKWLDPFRAHLNEAGLGQISEVFDGDAPHKPGGCIAQAWSVAEVLRATLEEAQEFANLTWYTKPIQAAYSKGV